MKTTRMMLAVLVAGAMASGAFAQDMDKGATQKSTTATTQAGAQKSTTTATTTQSGAQKGDRSTYRAAKKQVDDAYKAAKKRCDALGSGRIEKENCIGIARAERNYGRSQAMAQYKPTDKNQRDVKMAQAHLDYANAKAKCEAMGGNVKETGTEASLCMAKANEAKNQALAAAKADTAKAAQSGTRTGQAAKSATTSKRGDIGQEK